MVHGPCTMGNGEKKVVHAPKKVVHGSKKVVHANKKVVHEPCTMGNGRKKVVHAPKKVVHGLKKVVYETKKVVHEACTLSAPPGPDTKKGARPKPRPRGQSESRNVYCGFGVAAGSAGGFTGSSGFTTFRGRPRKGCRPNSTSFSARCP